MKKITVLAMVMSLSLAASATTKNLGATESLRAVLNPQNILSVETDMLDIFPSGFDLVSTEVASTDGENTYQVTLTYKGKNPATDRANACTVRAIVSPATQAVSFVGGSSCQ